MKITFEENNMTTELPYGDLNISADEEYGFRPFQLMVASIAGCSLSVFKKVLMKQRIDVEDVSVSVTVERNEAEANRIEQMDLTFSIKGKNLKEERLKKSLDTASNNCPMVRSVEDSIRIVKHLDILT